MDVFALCDRLIADYAAYIKSFIHIQDSRIRQAVDCELRDGLLWPAPLLQLPPSFEPGVWVENLVDTGILHPECRRIFRKEADKPGEAARVVWRAHRRYHSQFRCSSESYPS